MHSHFRALFTHLCPDVQFASLRWVQTRGQMITMRDDVLEPLTQNSDLGFMITIWHEGGWGYAASQDLSQSGLEWAFQRALMHAQETVAHQLDWPKDFNWPHPKGTYGTKVKTPWYDISLKDKVDLLTGLNQKLKVDDKIVYRESSLWWGHENQGYLTNQGGDVEQEIIYIAPDVSVTAADDKDAQTRSMSGRALVRQGGMEVIEQLDLMARGERMSQEALELLAAPNCPTGKMPVVLMPDQMILQIHESIGHPLETDRILGDERNYAGTTFVKPEMFGSFEYGSPLLNVTFDPTRSSEIASFAYDDEGHKAEKTFLIKEGILQAPLGSWGSMARSGLPGVANARSQNWNRAPIDRMANLNVEPGQMPLDEMISSVEYGVLMKTNRSWSIDDSRNKFQFGCEWGQLIEEGQLTKVVKNPNYRGVSSRFWRNLDAVGDMSTFEVMGTPFCGKGEPNQVIRVGHATPACRFRDIEVFGGDDS